MNKYLSAFTGALIAIMILLNGVLSNAFGNYTSSVMIHIVGLITITLVCIIRKQKVVSHSKIPLYLYSAGAIGVFTVVFTNMGFTWLGVSATIALGLLGQTIVSIVIDHFGLLGMKVVKFEKQKVIGLVFILVGVMIMLAF